MNTCGWIRWDISVFRYRRGSTRDHKQEIGFPVVVVNTNQAGTATTAAVMGRHLFGLEVIDNINNQGGLWATLDILRVHGNRYGHPGGTAHDSFIPFARRRPLPRQGSSPCPRHRVTRTLGLLIFSPDSKRKYHDSYSLSDLLCQLGF